MNKIITITSKGQFSLPATIRRKLGLNEQGDSLALHFDEKQKVVQLSKPTSFADMQRFTRESAGVKAAKIPEDIHGWYESERAKELGERNAT